MLCQWAILIAHGVPPASCPCGAGASCIFNTSASCPHVGTCSDTRITCSCIGCGSSTAPAAKICTTCPSYLPDTFTLVNVSHSGTRFLDKRIVVVGGTSGIGYATAAMLLQECALLVIVGGRNIAKGALAELLLGRIAKSHALRCKLPGRAKFIRADITDRVSVRNLIREAQSTAAPVSLAATNLTIDAVISTAAIPGWVGPLSGVPDSLWGGPHDAVQNNLVGTTTVATEVLRVWNNLAHLAVAEDKATSGASQPPPSPPHLVLLSSEQGLSPCPNCEQYAMSKHGIVGLATSLATANAVAVSAGGSGHTKLSPTTTTARPGGAPKLRVNVILPGLVDTPFTWNQARKFQLVDGKLVVAYPLMQTAWQCVSASGTSVIDDGDCAEGGSGYACPCADVRRDDPRVAALVATMVGAKILSPNAVAAAVLNALAAPTQTTTIVVPNERDDGVGEKERNGVRECPDVMWKLCPQIFLTS